MKSLILAIALTVQVVSSALGQLVESNHSYQYRSQQISRTSVNPGGLLIVSVNNTPAQTGKNDNQHQVNEDKQQTVDIKEIPSMDIRRDWIDYALLICNILLVIGGGITACIALSSLSDISTQTRAAVIAATAAKISAEAQMSGDRAWILVEKLKIDEFVWARPEEQKTATFSYTINNYGKTPAFVSALEIRFEIGSSSDTPPNLAIFGTEDFLINPHIIPQNDERPCNTELSPNSSPTSEQIKAIEESRLFLWVYGIVKYRDIYDAPHETRFCFNNKYSSTKAPIELQMAGDPKYNNAT